MRIWNTRRTAVSSLIHLWVLRKIMKKFSLIIILFLLLLLSYQSISSIQILSKTKLEKCVRVSPDSDKELNCTHKIVLDLAVPSESSGGEASIVAEVVEVEENSTNNMRTLRVPPVITVNKSAAFAIYALTYIRDVAYKPQEFYVQTRKCEPDADADVVQICERLRDEDGHIIEHTQPICCPCGDQRRVPSSCGNFFDKMTKGKPNTAHCLRFPGDWFHVFGVGQRSVGFSIRIEIKTKSKTSEVLVGPENRTATSTDKFLKASLVGDYVGYTDIPSFDNYYLVIPRVGAPGQPQNLGGNISLWMLLEKVRFTLDGLECDKIGVGFEAFNGQTDFCSAPFWSCLHNQLWNFWEADQNRISRHQVPLYTVQGRFERINQHPNAGSLTFSIGITEALNSNLLIELSADDIDYVYQRSPGKILAITVPTFEALTQYGAATITTQNVGEVEATYSLTFECSTGVKQMEEQFYIMKPKETITRPFKLYPASDQAAKYACAAILKDSDFSEVDRAECQFTTTATIIENGTQVPFQPPKTTGGGFFESIKEWWKKFWDALSDFIKGESCRLRCSGFFDIGCHVQYICMSWLLLFGLLVAIFPTVFVLLWLLHDKGLFDPLYEWWADHFYAFEDSRGKKMHKYDFDAGPSDFRSRNKYKHETKPTHKHHHHTHRRRKNHDPPPHRHKHHLIGETDYNYHLHHVHKDRPHKPGKIKSKTSVAHHKRYDDDRHHDIDDEFSNNTGRNKEVFKHCNHKRHDYHHHGMDENDYIDEFSNNTERNKEIFKHSYHKHGLHDDAYYHDVHVKRRV